MFRIIAIVLAVHLIQVGFVKLIGGVYLFYLSYNHFFGHRGEGEDRGTIKPAASLLGPSPFWSTVGKVELTDVVFALDSILVAVAMSPKTWVIIAGGILGIIAMRLVIGQLLRVVRRYPALVDGAFVIIAWVAVKLAVEYLGLHDTPHQQVGVVRADHPDLHDRVRLRAATGNCPRSARRGGRRRRIPGPLN